MRARMTVGLVLTAMFIMSGVVAAPRKLTLDDGAGSKRLATSLNFAASTGSIRHVGGANATVSYPGISPYNNKAGGSDVEFATINGRDYAFAGRLNANVAVIDITDPENPSLVAEVPCALYQNDVQVFQNRLLIMGQDNAKAGRCTMPDGSSRRLNAGFAVADISNPTRPRVIGIAESPRGAHNLTLHPTEPLIYLSNADLEGVNGQVSIWDISTPTSPVKVQDWNVSAASPPHDITFNTKAFEQTDPVNGTRTILPGQRAYSAAITHTDIFDTTDPRNPLLISTILHPDIQISHQADPTPDGKYLLVSDEVGGGTFAPVCPGGGVHVYKIGPEAASELAPVQVGVFWADPVGPQFSPPSCTAHVFRINPDGHTMAIAWYGQGVHIMDISNLIGLTGAGSNGATGVGVRTIASAVEIGADTWSAKMWQERHPGYVFANDIDRGFDVFFVPELANS